MGKLKIAILFITLACCRANFALARPAQQSPTGKCVIAGRVVMGETPVRGAIVFATYVDQDPRRLAMSNGFPPKRFTAKTDDHGRFRITDLKSGAYEVRVFAPATVSAEKSQDLTRSEMLGKRIALAADEVMENVNFSLVRGGVITGRVTLADGRPVIAEMINLTLEKFGRMGFENGGQPAETDDRGVYRIYGLPDGRYKVSLGDDGLGLPANRSKREKHKKTFYPGVTDEAAAEWIEIKNGNEVRDVDIKIGAGEKAYTVAGKVVDADTGQALRGLWITLDAVYQGGVSSTIGTGRANSQGEFKLEGAVTGTYAVYAYETTDPKQYYGEATRFEVNGANVSGIEVKVHRGLIVSGAAIIEGATDPALVSELSQMTVFASSMRLQKENEKGINVSSSAVAQVNSDGSFSLSGLRPGELRISAPNFSLPPNLGFVRVERNGLDVTTGFELKAGERVSDLRVVLAPTNCKIRGQVKVEGGTLVKNQEHWIRADHIAGNEDARLVLKNFSVRLDPNQRFLMDGLVAGEYVLTIYTRVLPEGKNDPGDAKDDDKQADGSVYRIAKQRVTVVNGQEAEVTLVIKAHEKSQ